MNTKVCIKCKEEKSLDQFYSNGHGGKRTDCVYCNKRRIIEHRLSKMTPIKGISIVRNPSSVQGVGLDEKAEILANAEIWYKFHYIHFDQCLSQLKKTASTDIAESYRECLLLVWVLSKILEDRDNCRVFLRGDSECSKIFKEYGGDENITNDWIKEKSENCTKVLYTLAIEEGLLGG